MSAFSLLGCDYLPVLLLLQRELPALVEVMRSQPVTSEQWSSYMDSDGRVTDVDAVKEAVFRGVSCML